MKVRKQIEDAEIHSGRPKGSVRLCAVSKFHPQEDVYSAIEGGQLLFGENRYSSVQTTHVSRKHKTSRQVAVALK